MSVSTQPKLAWRGPPRKDYGAEGINRAEYASSKECGWCGRRFKAWRDDLDEWLCFYCAETGEKP